MAGSREGGLITAQRNLERDPDHYRKIGAKGGLAGKGADYQKGGKKPSGFASNPEMAKIYGAKGGAASRKKGPNTKKMVVTKRRTKPTFALRDIEAEMTSQPNTAML